jgi:hypothetical protein
MRVKQLLLNGGGLILGVVFVLYGVIKLLGSQFIFSHDWVIDGRTTDGTTLVWCFFGYSPVYGRLIGLAELIPGLLLLVPRARLLGALVLLPVSANITVMDFCFGFPAVKYFALLLTLGCLLLVIGEQARLRQALAVLLTREPDASDSRMEARPVRRRWRLLWLPVGVLLAVVVGHQLAAGLSAEPTEAAYVACAEHGWARDNLQLLRWRTNSWSGINASGSVDFRASKGADARSVHVSVRRPHAFVAWQVVGYEERPSSDTGENR